MEAGGVVGWVLNRTSTTVGLYGLWLLSTSAGQCGGECYTLAVNVEMGPVFHSYSSQMPLYSVPQPFIHLFLLPLFPPPINDPFVRVFLPRWAGGPQQGQTPLCFFLDHFYTFFPFIVVFVSVFLLNYLSPYSLVLQTLCHYLTPFVLVPFHIMFQILVCML